MFRNFAPYVCAALMVSATDAAAATLKIKLDFGAPSANILVDTISTAVSSFSFSMVVDTSTADDRPFDLSFGGFVADSVRFTASELGIADVLVVSALEYFEDNDPGLFRVGIGPDNASAGLSLFTTAMTIGDPNLLDTTPNFSTSTAASGGNFLFTLANGQSIRINPGTTFGSASMSSVSVVPLPASALLLIGALGATRLVRRRRQVG